MVHFVYPRTAVVLAWFRGCAVCCLMCGAGLKREGGCEGEVGDTVHVMAV